MVSLNGSCRAPYVQRKEIGWLNHLAGEDTCVTNLDKMLEFNPIWERQLFPRKTITEQLYLVGFQIMFN